MADKCVILLLLLPVIVLSACRPLPTITISELDSVAVSDTENRQADGLATAIDEKDLSGNKVIVDFSTPSGIPLFKKLAMFTPSWTSGALFIKEINTLQDLRSDNMRLDLCLGYGGMGGSIGTGTLENMNSDYTALDMYSKLFSSHEVLPYWCYYATPYALQNSPSAKPWISPPSDYDAWYKVCYDIAKNLKDNGIVTFANEIWNEPDFDMFFSGKFSDYIQIYRYGSRGVHDADPDAVIGGLSAAFLPDRIRSGDLNDFLDTVVAEGLPLDFLSFHVYNANGVDPTQETILMREVLEQYPDLKSVRMHLNEYNIGFTPETVSSYTAPARTFDNLLSLNAQTDLEVVNWAMFLDATNQMSLVDTFGHEMALYHAFAFYNNMPYIRRSVINSSTVSAFASADEHNADAVLYNYPAQSDNETVTVKLEGVPFDTGNVTIYAIDSTHSSYADTKESDKLSIVYQAENISMKNLNYNIKMLGYATFLIEVTDGSGLSSLDTRDPVGTFIRRDYYYTDRGKNCYAEFDRLSQTAYFGMGTNQNTQSVTSVVYDDAADKISIDTSFSGDADAKGVCGLQLSYHTSAGYIKSVFYRIAGTSSGPEFPWGQTTEPEQILGSGLMVDLQQQAPQGFDGRIRISFLIKNMPVSNSAVVSITGK